MVLGEAGAIAEEDERKAVREALGMRGASEGIDRATALRAAMLPN